VALDIPTTSVAARPFRHRQPGEKPVLEVSLAAYFPIIHAAVMLAAAIW
jgi:hypothetical protein